MKQSSEKEHQMGDLSRSLTRRLDAGDGQLPLPGSGQTLQRWQTLADVAAEDLALAKLFEGHGRPCP